jgi:hypothetical protein
MLILCIRGVISRERNLEPVTFSSAAGQPRLNRKTRRLTRPDAARHLTHEGTEGLGRHAGGDSLGLERLPNTRDESNTVKPGERERTRHRADLCLQDPEQHMLRAGGFA